MVFRCFGRSSASFYVLCCLFCSFIVSFSLSVFTHAQSLESPYSKELERELEKESEKALEEMIVSAQKREQSISQVPLSLAVIDGDSLVLDGAKHIAAISQKIPNMTFDDRVTLAGSSAASSIYIRGIGQSDFLSTTDPGVGVYVDGVYLSRSMGSLLDVVNIDRIEVLRGPQGTLYGRNTVGGAINVVTQKPEADTAARMRMTIGADQRQEIVLTGNGQLSEGLNIRAHLGAFTRDGYVRRLPSLNANGDRFDGDYLGDEDSWVAQLSFDYHPSKNVSIFFSADATHTDDSAGAATLVGTFELCPNGVEAAFCDANTPNGGVPGQVFFFNNIAPITAYAGGVVGESHYGDEWIAYEGGDDNARDFSDETLVSYGTGEALSLLDVWGGQVTFNWGLPFANFKSITAYRTFDSYFSRDADHSPYTIYHTSAEVNQRQFSEELQLSGDSLNERLTWLIGLYYLQENVQDDSTLDLASLTIQSGGDNIEHQSLAAFFHGDVLLAPKWSLILGGRVTNEVKQYTPTQYLIFSHPALVPPQPPSGAVIVPSNVNKTEFSNTSYRLGFQYDAMPSTLLYGSLATGFKSGGFVQRNQVAKDELRLFKPEHSTTIEFGLRSEFWMNRARFNAAVFNTDYRDIQVRVIEVAGFSPITANAAQARIDGLEWDLTVQLTKQFAVRSAMGFIDAHYTQIGDDLSDVSLASRFVNTPDFSSSLGFSYEASVMQGNMVSRLDWGYTSDVYNDAENTALLKQKANHQMNTSLSYRPASKKWRTIAGVKNILDKKTIVSGNANRSLGSIVASYSRGRQWYITGEWEF